MSAFKKILVGIVVFIIVALLCAFILIQHFSSRALPDYNKNVILKGMTDTVYVYRDRYAIPHVYAKNEKDLYRAVGYLTAQDRLWQMDLLRRITLGRLAEIFGADLVETDYMLRALRIPEKTRMILDSTNEQIKEGLQAYCDGINSFIEDNSGKLPLEFTILGYKPEKWLPEHSVNLIGYMAFDLTMPWDMETTLYMISRKVDSLRFMEIVPDLKNMKSFVYPDWKKDNKSNLLEGNIMSKAKGLEDIGMTVFSGSNNWAMSGMKSANGKPILANDMHLGFSAPGIWYQMHMVIPGQLNVTGLVLPGQPLVVVGHNDSIAWGMTNVMVDDMDFYVEKINPNDTNEYEYMHEWLKMDARKEIFRIKGGEQVEKTLRFTHRGPIVSGIKGINDKAVSMQWTGNQFSNEIYCIYKLNHAGNWNDFTHAIRYMNSVSQNVVYADVKGNIGLYCSAGIPIRKKGDGSFIVPGWTDEYDWKGRVPFEQQPHVYNPDCGYVSSANNRTVGDDYPYPISRWFALPYRIDRIREMLNEKEKLDANDFIRMQADFKSKMAEQFNPLFIASINKATGLSPIETESLDMLKKWDYVLTTDSREASISETMFRMVVVNTFADELDSVFGEFYGNRYMTLDAMYNLFYNPSMSWVDDISTKDKKENLDDIIIKSFHDAIAELQKQLGNNTDKWRWGKIHTLTIGHPIGKVKILDKIFHFNLGPFPIGGSLQTVSPYAYKFTDPYKATHGASHRNIYITENWDKSLTVMPTGNCGIQKSKHYDDQTALYLTNKYHPDPFSKDSVLKYMRFRMIFTGK